MAWCGRRNRPASAATSCWCCRPHSPSGAQTSMPCCPLPHHTARLGRPGAAHHPAQQRHSPARAPWWWPGPAAMWMAPASGCAGSRPAAHAQRPAAGLAAGGAMGARNPERRRAPRRSRLAAAGRLAGVFISAAAPGATPCPAAARRRATSTRWARFHSRRRAPATRPAPGPGMARQITRDWVSPSRGGGKT